MNNKYLMTFVIFLSTFAANAKPKKTVQTAPEEFVCEGRDLIDGEYTYGGQIVITIDGSLAEVSAISLRGNQKMKQYELKSSRPFTWGTVSPVTNYFIRAERNPKVGVLVSRNGSDAFSASICTQE